MNNRIWNCKNPYQGDRKKVLCVCSAGLLRSPTAAVVLAQEPFNYNTRAAGITSSFALIPVDEVLIKWADEIVCMEETHKEELLILFDVGDKPIKVLHIYDDHRYMDEKLQQLIKTRMLEK